jgi:hypothetical protein
MLQPFCLVPSLFSELPSGSVMTNYHCSAVLELMKSLLDYGVIIVATEDGSPNSLLEHISQWPPKYQKRAAELLKKLVANKRFVKVVTPYVKAGCTRGCGDVFGLAAAMGGVTVVGGHNAHLCASGNKVISQSVTDYPTSVVCSANHAAQSFVIANGTWSKPMFEKSVLVPLFRYAKHVKVYDRYIGRTVTTFIRGGVGVARFKQSYIETIRWFLSVFLRVATQAPRSFEVIGALNAHERQPVEVAAAAQEFRNLEVQLRAQYSVPISLSLREEDHTKSMPHSRYLITDQIGILVERGFELLWNDYEMRNAGLNPAIDERRLRDVAVVKCFDCSAVATDTRKLGVL